ncbi:MAG: hypothetical protein KatS3mg114_0685 [Planctomycetaceae bacterium]|nr:MAG: hypothetical protein KatS3mg114_0685 [Planctomycetaceae bacterium]
MVVFRPFRNTDPPQVWGLWHACELGRGAALHVPLNLFEELVLSQPYFDPQGLILAEEGGVPVGYVHAGFRANVAQTALDYTEGVICAVMVHPQFRRRGIGRELVRRAEDYLQQRGARSIYAGPAFPRDPFYFGLYGGSQPAGFLESDPLAAPFFLALGYVPVERHLVYQRSLAAGHDPVGLRLLQLRRTTELTIVEQLPQMSWWWHTRVGRLDSLELDLISRGPRTPLARLTLVGLDHYLPSWKQRAIGVLDVQVAEALRRHGYAQALLVELCRRMRQELFQVVEGHAEQHDVPAIKLLESAGFMPIDAGVVYRRSLP